jgi:4'-phosphopantetheinyl transferase EntD
MTEFTKLIIDIAADTEVEVALTKTEIEERNAQQAAFEKKQNDFINARQSAIAKLAAIGLTEEEIRAL